MNWLKRLRTFLQEVVAETKKVTWPSKQEVINTTTVVLVASVIFGVYLYLCDFVVLEVIQRLFSLFGIEL